MRPSIFLNILLIAFISCREEKKTAVKVTPGNAEVKHAKRFALVYEGSDTRIYLFGNRNNNDTTARYLITSENRPGAADKFVVIKSPCTKIAALSSIYATMLVELGAIDKLVAIDNIDYVNNGQVREKFRTGQLKELARAPEVDVEQTIMLRPEVVLTFGMGDEVSGSLKKLSAAGIPVAVSIDHLE